MTGRLHALLLTGGIVLTALLSGCGNKDHETTATTFVEHVYGGEIARAVDLVNPATVELMGRQELMQMLRFGHEAVLAEGKALAGVSVQSSSVSEDGRSAEVVVEIQTGGGSVENERLRLIQVDERWYVRLEMGS